MIRGELQFTLSIAFRCVLHRNESLGIPCKNLVSGAREPTGRLYFSNRKINLNDPSAGSPTEQVGQ